MQNYKRCYVGWRNPTWHSFARNANWKQAWTYRPTVEELAERQQRKRGWGINGCCNFARKAWAIFKQAMNWGKSLKGWSDFILMDLYTDLVSPRNKTLDQRVWRHSDPWRPTNIYFANNLVRTVHTGHIPAGDLVAIRAHWLSSLKDSTTYFTFLAMKQNDTVVAAQCSCVPGQEEACSHVPALMFYLEDKWGRKTCMSLLTHHPLGDYSNGTCLLNE